MLLEAFSHSEILILHFWQSFENEHVPDVILIRDAFYFRLKENVGEPFLPSPHRMT